MLCVLHINNICCGTTVFFSLILQNADDLLVASAECPSDDEDLEECEPGNGESAQRVLSSMCFIQKPFFKKVVQEITRTLPVSTLLNDT